MNQVKGEPVLLKIMVETVAPHEVDVESVINRLKSETGSWKDIVFGENITVKYVDALQVATKDNPAFLKAYAVNRAREQLREKHVTPEQLNDALNHAWQVAGEKGNEKGEDFWPALSEKLKIPELKSPRNEFMAQQVEADARRIARERGIDYDEIKVIDTATERAAAAESNPLKRRINQGNRPARRGGLLSRRD